MVHTGGMTPDQFQTFRITPASATSRKSLARKRAQELAKIRAEGWEIVAVEPERFLRRGDKVTVSRPAQQSDPTKIDPEPTPLPKSYALIIGAVVIGLLMLMVIDVVF